MDSVSKTPHKSKLINYFPAPAGNGQRAAIRLATGSDSTGSGQRATGSGQRATNQRTSNRQRTSNGLESQRNCSLKDNMEFRIIQR